MAVLTSQVVHDRQWIKCSRCDGGAAFTARDIRQGAQCTYCDNKGEVPRFCAHRLTSDNSSFYEHMAGA